MYVDELHTPLHTSTRSRRNAAASWQYRQTAHTDAHTSSHTHTHSLFGVNGIKIVRKEARCGDCYPVTLGEKYINVAVVMTVTGVVVRLGGGGHADAGTGASVSRCVWFGQ